MVACIDTISDATQTAVTPAEHLHCQVDLQPSDRCRGRAKRIIHDMFSIPLPYDLNMSTYCSWIDASVLGALPLLTPDNLQKAHPYYVAHNPQDELALNSLG